MNTNNYIKKLKKIGLLESEAKVYFYLLKKKNFTAAEIAKLSHVSRSKIYEVLAKLVQKGLCTETLGKVKKYSPVSPEVVFANLYNEFEEKKKIVSDLSKSLLPLYLSEKENTDPLDYIQIIREKNAIAEKYNSLQRKAENQILCFSKDPYVVSVEKNIEGLNALKRGITTKTIYEVKESIQEGIIKGIESFIKAGEEVKFYQDLPIKMAVFDNTVVLLALVDRIQFKESFTTMIVHHPDIVESFIRMFEDHWQKAMNYKEFMIKEKL
ncbi:MAG: TrmB family transcriptional regulator [Candidatus Cloacimonetes bacterium]|nr:TrmB family transcriptional regulator [Candidatus Cloacimonadota bacterium]